MSTMEGGPRGSRRPSEELITPLHISLVPLAGSPVRDQLLTAHIRPTDMRKYTSALRRGLARFYPLTSNHDLYMGTGRKEHINNVLTNLDIMTGELAKESGQKTVGPAYSLLLKRVRDILGYVLDMTEAPFPLLDDKLYKGLYASHQGQRAKALLSSRELEIIEGLALGAGFGDEVRALSTGHRIASHVVDYFYEGRIKPKEDVVDDDVLLCLLSMDLDSPLD